MRKLFYPAFICLFSLSMMASSYAEEIMVRMETTKGNIELKLYPEESPIAVANFVQYVEDGYYNRMIFHRVVEGTLIQGGGFTKYFTKRRVRDPIENEAGNGLKNLRGTIAMARYERPHTATSQFFINVKDNDFLNQTNPELWKRFGYAVFGEVTSGMDVVDAIASVETGAGGDFDKEVPLEPILIQKITILETEE